MNLVVEFPEEARKELLRRFENGETLTDEQKAIICGTPVFELHFKDRSEAKDD